jgi:hypothetical protein
MKTFVSALLALGLIAGATAEAQAAACAAGPYRAGCAGPRGAVVTHRPYGYGGAAVVRPGYGAAVVRPAPYCYWRAGVRVCR